MHRICINSHYKSAQLYLSSALSHKTITYPTIHVDYSSLTSGMFVFKILGTCFNLPTGYFALIHWQTGSPEMKFSLWLHINQTSTMTSITKLCYIAIVSSYTNNKLTMQLTSGLWSLQDTAIHTTSILAPRVISQCWRIHMEQNTYCPSVCVHTVQLSWTETPHICSLRLEMKL